MDTTDPILHRADTAPSGLMGSLASRYEILGEVARGGMGVVYRAKHRSLDKQVALKMLLPGCSDERFVREARLLARINSPHVVVVHDFDVLSDGRPIIIMEWLDGGSLETAMKERQGILDEPTALRWMKETCQGMAATAAEGVIHRDLKPSNILIDSKGTVKVADFGLARGSLSVDGLSRTGAVMGTPHYMAPEQAEDPRSTDTRSDIYSFGATFYHALTGRPPFDGESHFSVLYKHKLEPLVSPKTVNPALSTHTSDLLERCMAKSPVDRFQTFDEVRQHLSRTTTSPWDESDDESLTAYMTRYQQRRSEYLADEPGSALDDGYRFPGGRTLRILDGNLVDQEVDAIVSSTDAQLTMGGGVALAIAYAGGREMFAEVSRYKPVRVGRVVVTSGGQLKARFVFHAVTLGVEDRRVVFPSRDLILDLMSGCFYHAGSLYVQSIAFPLLGTGTGGFSREVCLDTMFRFLAKMFLRGLTSVQEARIVLYRK